MVNFEDGGKKLQKLFKNLFKTNSKPFWVNLDTTFWWLLGGVPKTQKSPVKTLLAVTSMNKWTLILPAGYFLSLLPSPIYLLSLRPYFLVEFLKCFCLHGGKNIRPFWICLFGFGDFDVGLELRLVEKSKLNALNILCLEMRLTIPESILYLPLLKKTLQTDECHWAHWRQSPGRSSRIHGNLEC